MTSQLLVRSETGSQLSQLERLNELSPHSYRHSKRSGILANRVSNQLFPASPELVKLISFCALTHDLGKSDPQIAELVDQPRKLSDDEKAIVKGHTNIGSQMLRRAGASISGHNGVYFDFAAEVALKHHDQKNLNSFTGNLTAFVSVIDTFDAISGEQRPYQNGELTGASLQHADVLTDEDVYAYGSDPQIFQVNVSMIVGMLNRFAANRAN